MSDIYSKILRACEEHECSTTERAKTLALTKPQMMELARWLKPQPWFDGATKSTILIADELVGGSVNGLTIVERDKMIVVDD